MIQYPGYLSYAASNPYHPLVNRSVIDQVTANWSAPDTGCQARVKEIITVSSLNHNEITILQIAACNKVGTNSVCSGAQSFCNEYVLEPLAGKFDVRFLINL